MEYGSICSGVEAASLAWRHLGWTPAFFSEVEREVGKPASEMNRQEKMRALAYLDSRGVFQIAKAHVHLCKFFGISKFTLYNYLDEVRKSGSSE